MYKKKSELSVYFDSVPYPYHNYYKQMAILLEDKECMTNELHETNMRNLQNQTRIMHHAIRFRTTL